MTVGIGILNRSGVVLASDTFDPVIGIGAMKFVSINKIFPLSKHHPVGVVLDGSVRYMDVIPWETIIEVYWSYIGDKSFDTLEEYAKSFIDFLPNDNRFYSYSAEVSLINIVMNYCVDKVTGKDNLEENNREAIADKVEKEIKFYSKESFINPFDDNFFKLFLEKHRKDLEEYLKSRIDFDIDLKTQENLILMCAYVTTKSNYMSENINLGSIVISGYGDKEIFPSLYRYKIVGTIDGKLIYRLEESYSIGDDEEDTKKIIPFGEEKDLINTYIKGINPELEKNILMEIEKSFNEFLKEIQNKYNKNHVLQQFIEKEKDEINSISKMVMKGLMNHINDLQQMEFISPLLYMVDFIRKEDMISLAEALVNLTSISVKFTPKKKAEVGPIDIAFITKGDGFQWIKRKEFYKYRI